MCVCIFFIALGKGPFKLLTYRDRGTLLAVNKTSGLVFPKRDTARTDEVLTLFMMTPGLSKVRPHGEMLKSNNIQLKYFHHPPYGFKYICLIIKLFKLNHVYANV